MTGGRTIALIMAGLAWGVSAVPARGQEVSQPEPTRIGVLFDSDAPLRLRFEGDLRTLLKDRDSVEATYHPFTLTYQVGDASPVAVPVELKLKTPNHEHVREIVAALSAQGFAARVRNRRMIPSTTTQRRFP